MDTLAGVMLTAGDRAILDLERTWWTEPGTKEAAILDRVGMDASDYYRRLGSLLTKSEADAYDPLTVRRLRKIVAGGHPSVRSK